MKAHGQIIGLFICQSCNHFKQGTKPLLGFYEAHQNVVKHIVISFFFEATTLCSDLSELSMIFKCGRNLSDLNCHIPVLLGEKNHTIISWLISWIND